MRFLPYNERIPYGYNICLAWNKKPDEVDAERFLPFTEVTYSHFRQGCLMAGCLKGGSCLFDEGKDTFACSCNPQWRGEICHMGKDWQCSLFTSAIITTSLLFRSYVLRHIHLRSFAVHVNKSGRIEDLSTRSVTKIKGEGGKGA